MQAKIERVMWRAIKIAWIGGGLMWLVLAGPSVSGAPSASSSPGSPQSVTTGDETSIDALRREVADLRSKIDKPPKDLWDKFASVSGFASGLVVALIGFYATNVYNRRQRVTEEQRKDQAIGLEEKRLDHERQKWREELSNQVTLKILETRLIEYAHLWARIELVAKHQMYLGNLTQELTRELASYVQKWRYSPGGLLAAPITRDAAIAFQTAVLEFNGTEESYRRIRDARRILRDALRADLGVHEILGRNLIDQAANLARIEADLAKLQVELPKSPEADA